MFRCTFDSKKLPHNRLPGCPVSSASESVTIVPTKESLGSLNPTAPPWLGWRKRIPAALWSKLSSWNVPTTSKPSFVGEAYSPKLVTSHASLPVARHEAQAPRRHSAAARRRHRRVASPPQARISRRRLHQRAQRHALEQRRASARAGRRAALWRPRRNPRAPQRQRESPHRRAAKSAGSTAASCSSPRSGRAAPSCCSKRRRFPSQAHGRTKVQTNLRVQPGRTEPRLYQFGRGVPVEVVGRSVADWVQTSDEKDTGADVPTKKEDWYLVRAVATRPPGETSARTAETNTTTRPGDQSIPIAGWVISRFVELDLPDPVREGLNSANVRAVAWFELNRVPDPSGEKPQYLVAGTKGPEGQACDFTTLRAYTWDAKKSRYETAFIENNLCGALPITRRQRRQRRARIQVPHARRRQGRAHVSPDPDGHPPHPRTRRSPAKIETAPSRQKASPTECRDPAASWPVARVGRHPGAQALRPAFRELTWSHDQFHVEPQALVGECV